tara:strand:- start:14918 stop:15880 length:963 start_codon:yes stop_codon:yes gene_type:complete
MSYFTSSFLVLKKAHEQAQHYREVDESELEFHFVDFQQKKPIRLKVELTASSHFEQWFYQKAPAILSSDQYFKSLERLLTYLAKAEQNKVVFSRAQLFDLALKPLELFEKLCKAYPAATVYLFSHPTCGTWLGASPETLLTFKGQVLETASLAGTLAYNESVNFGEKEKLEQDIVTNYIIETLNSVPGISHLEKSQRQTVRAGNLKHLFTAIKGRSIAPLPLDALLEKLHPTPAVAGNPKNEALELITALEQYDRSYYTGYFGLKKEKEGHFWVNLRCAQIISSGQICLYAGGGIISASEPQLEWRETESKMQTILNVMR